MQRRSKCAKNVRPPANVQQNQHPEKPVRGRKRNSAEVSEASASEADDGNLDERNGTDRQAEGMDVHCASAEGAVPADTLPFCISIYTIILRCTPLRIGAPDAVAATRRAAGEVGFGATEGIAVNKDGEMFVGVSCVEWSFTLQTLQGRP